MADLDDLGPFLLGRPRVFMMGNVFGSAKYAGRKIYCQILMILNTEKHKWLTNVASGQNSRITPFTIALKRGVE